MSLANAETRFVHLEQFLMEGPFRTESFDVPAGTSFDAPQLVAVLNGSRNLAAAVKGGAGGAETPIGIVVDNVANSASAQSVSVYVTGEFNGDLLNYDASYTDMTDVQEQLRKAGNGEIILKSPTFAGQG